MRQFLKLLVVVVLSILAGYPLHLIEQRTGIHFGYTVGFVAGIAYIVWVLEFREPAPPPEKTETFPGGP